MVLGKIAKYQYVLNIKGLMCGHCEANISEALRKVKDVVQVRADHQSGEVLVKTNRSLTEEELGAVVRTAGYELLQLKEQA